MEVQFVTSIAPIVRDAAASRCDRVATCSRFRVLSSWVDPG
jgi:hypothetical protein